MSLQIESEWKEDFIWNPYRLYKDFIHPITKHKCELYCKWDKEDTWSFFIFVDNKNIFLGDGCSKDDNIDTIQHYAEELLNIYFEKEM